MSEVGYGGNEDEGENHGNGKKHQFRWLVWRAGWDVLSAHAPIVCWGVSSSITSVRRQGLVPRRPIRVRAISRIPKRR